ncbi:MAG: MerR family transcriptional regulator [Clostridiales bacterium]
MRIGDFAAKYKQPLNSIYYYIKIGLLVPAKKATQYDFDEMCEQDLQMIIIFKQWDFSLKEIHAVLSLYRYSNLMHPDDIKGVTDFMDHKCRLLLEEKERLEQIIGQISQARQNIQNSFDLNPPRCSGVPLCMLELLVCPHCGQELRIEDAMMNPRYIFNSKLNCSCGYQAQIKNGILLTPNTNRSACDHPDLQRHQYTDMPL